MEGALSLLTATVILFVASGVQAQSSFSNANNTQLNITMTGCGVTKLCVSTPSQCDPAGNGTCLFGSVRTGNTSAPNGTTAFFQLSGSSTGYIALGISSNANQSTALLFICGQNSSANGFFFNAVLWNSSTNSLPQASTTVTSIQGNVNGNKIQCGFTVPGLNSTTLNRDSNTATTFAIFLGSGSITGSTLGSFNLTLNSGLLNIANPSANVNTTAITTPATNTTGTTATTGAGGALHPHAVTLVLSVLTLCGLKMA